MSGTHTAPLNKDSTSVAHVAPLALFIALNFIPGWLRIENPELPWHQRAPEHWVYPLQTIVTGLLLLWFRKHYRLAPCRGFGVAFAGAAVGIVVWVLPAWWHGWMLAHDLGAPPKWLEWLGVVERCKGFDPTVLSTWPVWEKAAIVMRFVRMVVVVPLVEELFWRGFLMRYIVAGDRPWQQVPFGIHDWRSYAIVTTLVTITHNPEDYLGAFVWGSLVYFVAVRTRSLAACVVMHAVGNSLLGAYVLTTRSWGFW